LQRIPAGQAEIVCEESCPEERRRKLDLHHPIHRLKLGKVRWPFLRGDRLNVPIRYLAFPWMVTAGMARIASFRPDCILTVLYSERWVASGYALSKLSGLPWVLYVHDLFLEQAEHRGGVEAALARWLEPRALKGPTVIALSKAISDRYRRKYGIDAPVVRQIATRARASFVPRARAASDSVTVGFAGAIYDNNRELMTQLAEATKADARIHLKLWTDAQPPVLQSLGLVGERVTVQFERDYDSLIAQLGKCDLLYMPLSFADTPSLPRALLEDALPSKAIDYLVAGPPLLVHCPADYELGRFFAERGAAHLLTSDAPGALSGWLSAWLAGRASAIPEAAVMSALREFDPEGNWRRFWGLLEQAASRAEAPASVERRGAD
jgi:glycosyl transferase family 4